MIPVKETKGGVSFNIRVVPRSSRSELCGLHEDALKLKIAAPPVDGQANDECVRFLAGKLGVRRSQISIAAGLKAKQKTVFVSGLTAVELRSKLTACGGVA